MSGNQGALNHIEHGEFLAGLHDVAVYLKNRFVSLPAWVQNFLNKTGTQEYNILQGLVSTGVNDVVAGGLTTASFVQAGKDIFNQLVAQNISTFTMQDVMANLNMAVSAAVPIGTTVVPQVQVAAAPAAEAPSPFNPAVLPPSAPVASGAVNEPLPDNVAGHSITATTTG